MNVAAYQLGVGPVLEAQSDPIPGADGSPPSAVELQGSRADKTGLFALEKVDLFNILTLPNQSDPALQAAAIAYAEERRAFIILDLPASVDTVEEAQAWLTANGALRHRTRPPISHASGWPIRCRRTASAPSRIPAPWRAPMPAPTAPAGFGRLRPRVPDQPVRLASDHRPFVVPLDLR
jgi:hypothetical protein